MTAPREPTPTAKGIAWLIRRAFFIFAAAVIGTAIIVAIVVALVSCGPSTMQEWQASCMAAITPPVCWGE